jgi:glutamine synthetase
MQTEREARENVTPSLPEDTLWIRFAFVDHAGIPKAKAVHRNGFGKRSQAGVGLAKGVLALDPSGALHPESGLSPVGECRLVPDLSTLTLLPFASNQAMVTCDMTEPDATTPWEGCPRSALKRVLGRLAERGYRSVASYEAEFYVWGPEGPLDRTPYAGSFALTTAADYMVELAQTLKEMGIRPEQCHAEVGHGKPRALRGGGRSVGCGGQARDGGGGDPGCGPQDGPRDHHGPEAVPRRGRQRPPPARESI